MDTVTIFIAWWGAILATAVFVWDVYKWRKSGRPRLVITANGNLIEASRGLNPPIKTTYISVKVTNVGDKATTLQLITFRFYKTSPRKWRKEKADKRGLFQSPISPSAPLPHKLDVGEVWSGMFLQTEEIEQMSKDGYFYFEAEDSSTFNAMKHARARLLLE